MFPPLQRLHEYLGSHMFGGTHISFDNMSSYDVSRIVLGDVCNHANISINRKGMIKWVVFQIQLETNKGAEEEIFLRVQQSGLKMPSFAVVDEYTGRCQVWYELTYVVKRDPKRTAYKFYDDVYAKMCVGLNATSMFIQTMAMNPAWPCYKLVPLSDETHSLQELNVSHVASRYRMSYFTLSDFYFDHARNYGKELVKRNFPTQLSREHYAFEILGYITTLAVPYTGEVVDLQDLSMRIAEYLVTNYYHYRVKFHETQRNRGRLKGDKRRQELLNAVLELYYDNWSYREIAAELSIAKSTVYDWIQRYHSEVTYTQYQINGRSIPHSG